MTLFLYFLSPSLSLIQHFVFKKKQKIVLLILSIMELSAFYLIRLQRPLLVFFPYFPCIGRFRSNKTFQPHKSIYLLFRFIQESCLIKKIFKSICWKRCNFMLAPDKTFRVLTYALRCGLLPHMIARCLVLNSLLTKFTTKYRQRFHIFRALELARCYIRRCYSKRMNMLSDSIKGYWL